jgi:hypothetical protein
MSGSCDEEKGNVLRFHHTTLVYRMLDVCLTTALRLLYAWKA